MKKSFLLLIFFFQLISAQTIFEKEPDVRIRIINTVDTLNIIFNSEWQLISETLSEKFSPEDGEIKFIIQDDNLKIIKSDSEIITDISGCIIKSLDDNGTLKIKNVPFGVGWWWENKEDRIYEGNFNLYKNSENKFDVVISLPLEEYLKGVVPYEIGGDSPLEAIKAQAVAARSEAVMALTAKMYSGPHHDLTADVECQVFSGNRKRTDLSDRAVEETRSLILSENGLPINAYYASNCGGHSELIKNVWADRPLTETYKSSHSDWDDSLTIDLSVESNAREWIFSNPPSNCNPEIYNDLPSWSKSNFRWKKEFTTEVISKMTARGKDLGSLIDIKILNRGTSGRIYNAVFCFEKDSIKVNGELKIRQMFNPSLKSSCFVVEKSETGFVFYGAGWGHGVGMCQSGAITMAKKGNSFDKILSHYYRKSLLLKIY